MFAFKLWSHFGAFRDPITITQNITLSIPPKTTIGGMLAAILGMDYNEYFENPDYFDFGYSLVLLNPIRKKSFSQNYIEDYTAKSHLKHEGLRKVLKKSIMLEEHMSSIRKTQTKDFFEDFNDTDLENDEKLDVKQEDFQKALENYNEIIMSKMPKPKPIRRELLIKPSYLVFIKDFGFEEEAVNRLKAHRTGFALYMGNSEFAANYQFVDCQDYNKKPLSRIDSFTQFQDRIKFEPNRKYTTVYSATKTIEGRKYRDYKKIIICDDFISFNTLVNGVWVKTSAGEYNCEFI
jgi:CRISPR-associated protein Cas5h